MANNVMLYLSIYTKFGDKSNYSQYDILPKEIRSTLAL